MFNLEKSIQQWLKQFHKHRAFDHGSLREMEMHLKDHIEDLISEGHTEESAFNIAKKEFGEVPAMAKEEFWNKQRKPNLRTFLYGHLLNNYFKTSFRSIMRNPMSSFINLLGLSIAIGICVLAFAFIQYTYKIDQFHEHKDEVYLVTFFADRDGEMLQNGTSPAPIAKSLEADFGDVTKSCRVERRNIVVKYQDKVFLESVRYVDPQFLEMLTFPLKWGTPASLNDVNSIILSENMSEKYFGDSNPIGQSLKVIMTEKTSKIFKVTGVAKEFPGARSFAFDFLINFENFAVAEPEYNTLDWEEYIDATFIQVSKSADVQYVLNGMDKYKGLANDRQGEWDIDHFGLEPLSTLVRNSEYIRNDIAATNFSVLSSSCISFIIIGFFVLALASSNYINIAIVSAAKRLKEIALRKVIGANRRMVMVQFLGENMLLMAFALVFGLLFGVNIFIPWLEGSSNFDMDFDILNVYLWLFLPLILVFTGLISGLYPALFISKFQVASIFKGSFSIGKKNLMTRIFLGFQLVLACILISVAVMFTQNTVYQNSRSWGYSNEQVIYAQAHSNADYEKLYSAMHQNANIESISGSKHHLGKKHVNGVIDRHDREFEIQKMEVDAEYFETMSLQLSSGSFFNGSRLNDKKGIVINETLVKQLEIEDPLGEILKIDGSNYEVIGVVQDFHSYNFYYKVRPVALMLGERQDNTFLSIKVQQGSELESYKELQNQWSSLFPEIPFIGGFQSDVWGNYKEEMKSNSRFWRALATMVVLMASLGLYGLVTLNVTGRVREFSIRKVLGAGIQNITSIIAKQYMIIFVVAFLIGTPISYYLTQFIFDMFYVYHMPMNFSFVSISSTLLILVLLVIVFSQIKRISTANPVDGLKVE